MRIWSAWATGTFSTEDWKAMLTPMFTDCSYTTSVWSQEWGAARRRLFWMVSLIAGNFNGVHQFAGYVGTQACSAGISHSLYMELRILELKEFSTIYPGSIQTNSSLKIPGSMPMKYDATIDVANTTIASDAGKTHPITYVADCRMLGPLRQGKRQ